MTLYHGSCMNWLNKGILITGASGSGKSDVCFRLIDKGAILIADDQVLLENKNKQLLASCPEALEGLLEVRGLGILKTLYQKQAKIDFQIELAPLNDIERLPQKTLNTFENIEIPVLKLYPFCPSSLLKIKTFISLLEEKEEIL